MQLVKDTAKDILECLHTPRAGRSVAGSTMLQSVAEQRPRHELLHHFGELSRLLKGRQGTAQHEQSETSLWTQSLLDQFVLEPREVSEYPDLSPRRKTLPCHALECSNVR